MYGPRLYNEYIKGVDAFIDFSKKDMLDNIRGNICCPYKHYKNEKRYRTDNVLRSHLIKHGFMEDYRCWNKHGDEGLNEVEMGDSYLKREAPIGVEEDHDDDVKEADISGFTDDDIEFQEHNIEEMICNIKRHGDDDKYSNGELAKYKKMIEDSMKPLYYGYAAQYTRLFAMVKLFQLKASNRWSDCSFKELLMLLNVMLPQGNVVPKTVYEAKQIICPLGLKVEKIHTCKNNCILYRGPSTKTSRNALFVDLIDSIIEKTTVMMRTAIETEEKTDLKRCFGIFLSFLV
jgi:hypothetical protein